MAQKEQMRDIAERLGGLEADVLAIQRIVGSGLEKKDPKAWDRLEKLGEKIAKERKIRQPSWKILSESRR